MPSSPRRPRSDDVPRHDRDDVALRHPDPHEATAVLEELLAPALDWDPRTLADRLPIGPPARCAEVLSAYAEVGAKRVLLWPDRDGIHQLRACAEQVLPQVADGRRPGL
jgi:hypothetical protein